MFQLKTCTGQYDVDENGFYGSYGGSYIPELLHNNIQELKENYLRIISQHRFKDEYEKILTDFVGRPTPLFFAEKLSYQTGARVYLKREDLAHTGSHKINNAVGQVLLARALGKTNIIAETGAGQHGVATATVCALAGIPCKVFMGKIDMKRQQANVDRMKMLGAEVLPVSSGAMTLKDATNEALRYWISHPYDTHYLIGSVVGPHPFPDMVARFQSVISWEIKKQLTKSEGRENPDYIIACVGGGSNAAGAFYHYLDRDEVTLVGVEAAGEGLMSGRSAATLKLGKAGILHGSKSFILQNNDGQIAEAHSVSAGLDYPGVGPLHAYLVEKKRIKLLSATDSEAIAAGINLSRLEGIIPAVESAHALAALVKLKFKPNDVVVLNLSGRGDKDLEIYKSYGPG
jgi:tryptophan synthase beta chain